MAGGGYAGMYQLHLLVGDGLLAKECQSTIDRGMVHPSAEVAECPPTSMLTKNSSRLEVWQQGVPGE